MDDGQVNQEVKRKSRNNDIFNVDHAVAKPLYRMCQAESEDLRLGRELSKVEDVKRNIHRIDDKKEEKQKIGFENGVDKIPKYRTEPDSIVEGENDLLNDKNSSGGGYRQEEKVGSGEYDELSPTRMYVSCKISSNRSSLLGYGLNSRALVGTMVFYNKAPITNTMSSQYKKSNNNTANNKNNKARVTNHVNCAVKIFENTNSAIESFVNELKSVTLFKENNISIPNFLCTAIIPIEKNQIQISPVAATNCPFDDPLILSLIKSANTQSSLSPVIFYEYSGRINLWDWLYDNYEIVYRHLWIKWAHQLSSALEYLNNLNILHLDVKPHNVIVGDNMCLKLIDFGDSCQLSHLSTSSSHSYNNLLKGTLAYKAPEIFSIPLHSSAPFPITPAVDIYSLGVTLWTIISGITPFSLANSQVQLIIGISKGFFVSGLQAPSKATPLCPSMSPSDWNFKFANDESVGVDIQFVLASILDVDPNKRFSAAQLSQELYKLLP